MPRELPLSQRLLRLPAALLNTADHVIGNLPVLFGPGSRAVTGPER